MEAINTPSKPFTEEERRKILQQQQEALQRREALIGREDFDAAWGCLQEAQNWKARYFERLPKPVMSCCPFDQKPLRRSFDPFGLDGPWWEPDAITQEPPSCPHFCVLQGAVNFAGKPPLAGKHQIRPGPQVPFVIPRLLEYEGMIAVISQLRMENGYIAYPVAYFALRRP